MILEYSVTGIKLKHFSPLLGFFLISVIMYFIFVKSEGPGTSGVAIIGFSIMFLLQLFPFIALYEDYYSENKADRLVYDSDKRTIIFIKGNNAPVEFTKNDVLVIKYYMSYPHKNQKGAMLAWDKFCYCDILLPDDKHVIITSLLVPDLDAFIKDMDFYPQGIQRIPGLFSSIS